MPDLAIQVQEIKGVPGTALVILNGSIDAKTVITFQTHLNSVKERGIDRFILDMEAVKYVNSTGLGYLINLSDSVGGDSGGISLVKVQPKVKVVFDMLGLNAFFKIYTSREEAVKALSDAPVKGKMGSTTILKPSEAKKITEAAKPAAPKKAAVPPPPPPPKPAARIPAPAPAPALAGRAKPAGPTEPVNIDCTACRTQLKLTEVGTYKCPRCLTLFTYQGQGRVSFLPRQKTIPVQLTLNFTPECTDGFLEFVRCMAAKVGFNDGGVEEVRSVAKDTVETIRKHAYGGNEKNVYHVLLLSREEEIELRFADYGQSLNSGKGDLFGGQRKKMDRVELKHHPRGGNVVTLSKKVK